MVLVVSVREIVAAVAAPSGENEQIDAVPNCTGESVGFSGSPSGSVMVLAGSAIFAKRTGVSTRFGRAIILSTPLLISAGFWPVPVRAAVGAYNPALPG